MANWKIKIKKIFKSNGYKTIYYSRNNLYSSTPKKQSIKMKQNQLDDCKVKIFENKNKFDILTKDSVWNIEKRAFKT